MDIFDYFSLLLIFILILFVGFFTSSETAYLSLNKIKLRRMLEEKKKKSGIVAKLKSNMSTLLTTVLIGTNFLNSLVSALATSFVVKMFGGDGVGLPTLLTAFFITTFGQIIPKTIAARYPEKITLFSSLPLFILEKIFFPIIYIFENISKGAVFLFQKVMKPDNQIITEDELKTLIEVGEKEGTIEKNESKMLNKVIKLNDISTSDIMKHRSFVKMVSVDASYEQVKKEFLDSGFSMITVYQKTEENVVGVLHYKKIFSEANHNKEDYLQSGFAGRVMDEVLFVPATFSALELLQKIRDDENQFAVVLNEQGQAIGIVTMEDIIRVVFGRMTDENSYDDLPAEDKIQLVSANTFIVPGELKLEELNSVLNLNLESEEMNTLGGWILEKIGYLPSVGMVLVKNKVVYTVEDVSQRRIISVRIKI